LCNRCSSQEIDSTALISIVAQSLPNTSGGGERRVTLSASSELPAIRSLCQRGYFSHGECAAASLSDPSRLCNGNLPLSLMSLKYMYEPKLSAIVLPLVLPSPDNPPPLPPRHPDKPAV
jgi:hypothetical protein